MPGGPGAHRLLHSVGPLCKVAPFPLPPSPLLPLRESGRKVYSCCSAVRIAWIGHRHAANTEQVRCI